MVIVDVQHLCYDNAPYGGRRRRPLVRLLPLAPVSFDPSPNQSVATATLRDITGQRGGGHNVVVMLPSSVLEPAALLHAYPRPCHLRHHTGCGRSAGTPSPSVPEAYAWASDRVAPAASGYDSANQALEAFPTTYSPPLGSLQGQGLYQSQLIYSLNGSNIGADLSEFQTFGGLIPTEPRAHGRTAPPPGRYRRGNSGCGRPRSTATTCWPSGDTDSTWW